MKKLSNVFSLTGFFIFASIIPAFADVGAVDIYTVGNIDSVAQAWKGLIMILSGTDWTFMLKLAISIGFLNSIFIYWRTREITGIAKYMVVVISFTGLFFAPVVTINIHDTKYGQDYSVSGAPYIPAYINSALSSMSHTLTNLTQVMFHIGTVNVWDASAPSGNAWSSSNLDYTQTGFGGFSNYVNLMRRMQFNGIADDDVIAFLPRLDAYIQQCTMLEIVPMSPEQVRDRFYKTGDLWSALAPQVNSFMDYNGLTTCVDFWNGTDGVNPSLNTMWTQTILPKFQGQDTKILAALGLKGSEAPSFVVATTEIIQDGASELSSRVGQAGLMRALQYGAQQYVQNDGGDPKNITFLYDVGMNVERTNQLGKSLWLFAQEAIPTFKAVMESLNVILLPVSFIFALISYGAAITMFTGVLRSTANIYMWDVVLAAVNGLVNAASIAELHARLNAQGATGVFNIISYNAMIEVADEKAAIAGFLAMMTPAIAYGMVKGGELVLTQLLSMAASSVMSQSPAAEAMGASETQKLADETGKSFGDVEMSRQAAGQAKLEAMAFMSESRKLGYGNMLDSSQNRIAHGVGSGLGFGTDGHAFDVGRQATEISAASTTGQYAAGGGDSKVFENLSRLDTTKKIADYDKFHKNMALRDEYEGRPVGSTTEYEQHYGTHNKMENQAVDTGMMNTYLTPDGRVAMKEFSGAGWRSNFDGAGNLLSGSVDNASLDFGFARKSAIVNTAAHELATNTEFAKTLSEGKDFSASYGVSREHSDALRHSYDQNLAREIANDKSFKETLNAETSKQLYGRIEAGGGLLNISKAIGIDGKVAYQITGTTKEGSGFAMDVSAKTAERFSEMQTKAAEDAVKTVSSTKEGLSYVSNLSTKVGASEAARLSEQAQHEQSATTNEKIVATAAFAQYMTREMDRNPGESNEHLLNRSFEVIAGMAKNNPVSLHQKFEEFASSWQLKPGNVVNDSVTSEVKAAVGPQFHELKAEASGAASLAAGKTGGITEGAVSKDPTGGVKGPDKHAGDLKVKQQNDFIDAKKESLAPDPTFMAAEGAGKIIGEVADSGAPLPLASKGEQERRLKELKDLDPKFRKEVKGE